MVVNLTISLRGSTLYASWSILLQTSAVDPNITGYHVIISTPCTPVMREEIVNVPEFDYPINTVPCIHCHIVNITVYASGSVGLGDPTTKSYKGAEAGMLLQLTFSILQFLIIPPFVPR